MFDRIILTCEHGGNRVPPRYAAHFAGAEDLLASHRGYDIGALSVARELSEVLAAPLYPATVTRLLVELNRSVGHPRLFSERVRDLDEAERARILARYYVPHRRRVEQTIAQVVRARLRVLHVAVHSFTPVLDGEVRNADVGLLYDPARPGERGVCSWWKQIMDELAPALRVRRNYPYRGNADGFTTYLRTCFPDRAYLGIELEMNQAMLRGPARARLVRALKTSLLILPGVSRPDAKPRATLVPWTAPGPSGR